MADEPQADESAMNFDDPPPMNVRPLVAIITIAVGWAGVAIAAFATHFLLGLFLVSCTTLVIGVALAFEEV